MGQVAHEINNLSNRIGNMRGQELAHEENMLGLGLRKEQMNSEMMGLSAERALKAAQAERDKYLDEPVLLQDAINTSKMPEDRKKAMLSTLPKDLLALPTTRRKAVEAYNSLAAEQRQTKLEQDKMASNEKVAGIRASAIGSGPSDPGIEFSPEEIDYHAGMFNLKGTLPALGMGKSKLRMQILQRAAQLAKSSGGDPAKTLTDQAGMAGMKGSIAQQEKQLGAMGSFVKNLDSQVEKVGELAKELQTYDTRLLNVPLRSLRGRLAGSALQAKYDMYLAEIESEIGKLATGSTGSVAELSQGAQERWARIHDKNLSIKDMLSLLEETKNAGRMRLKSVEEQLSETRARMQNTGRAETPTNIGATPPPPPPPIAPQTTAPQSAIPPVEGAKQAPDGNWYVEQNGRYFKVEQ